MAEVWTAEELADKADHEGGIGAVLEWGGPLRIARVEGVPDELWAAFVQAWTEYSALEDAVRELLPEPT